MHTHLYTYAYQSTNGLMTYKDNSEKKRKKPTNLTSVKMASIKKSDNESWKENSYSFLLGVQASITSIKKLKEKLPYDLAIYTYSGHIYYTHNSYPCLLLLSSGGNQECNQPRYPSKDEFLMMCCTYTKHNFIHVW